MGITTDPHDPGLRKVDANNMQEAYLVLSEDERAKGYVRPVRKSYFHTKCGTVTTMGDAIAATYARDPLFYGATYCVSCRKHFPVGINGEFIWDDGSGQKVGT